MQYLQHVHFQKLFCQSIGLDNTLWSLLTSFRLADTISHMQASTELSDAYDYFERLSLMRSKVARVLSDISLRPEFAVRCQAASPLSSYLCKWLSSPQSHHQVCACIMLVNIARSDSVCEELISINRIHKPLLTIIAKANDTQLLCAALGLLKDLALPTRNKVELGDAGIIQILPRL